MNKNYLFGIGIALAVLLVFAAPAAAHTVYFEPQHSNASTGNSTYVKVYLDLDAGETLLAGQLEIMFDPECADITKISKKPDEPANYSWNNFWQNLTYTENGYAWNGVADPFCEWDYEEEEWILCSDGLIHGPAHVKICRYKIEAVGTPGTTSLVFGDEMFPGACPVCQRCKFCNVTGEALDITWVDGTFTHEGVGPQAYTVSGYTDPAATRVNITNMDKSEVVDERPADYIDPATGFYNLTLNIPDEVDTGDVLRIIACDVPDNYTSNCNVTDHTVDDIGGEENVNLTLNHYCQNYYPRFPFHTWDESNWSGPAAMEMLIDNYRDTSDVQNQTVLNETGLGYNQACNADILFVDPLGMKSTLNLYLHAYEGLPYVANYGIGNYDTIEGVLHYICKWQYLGPGAAPAYGNYSNWMVIRGIHTNKTPSFTKGSYEIYGFWINDPYNATLEGPGGIGENTYKSVDQWGSIYHKKLNESGVNTSDDYYNKYVAVCEPPEDDDVVVTLAHTKPRLAEPITPALAEEQMMVYGIEQLALEKVVRDDELLKIVKAAINGVNEELVPYDKDFADVFAKTVPGKPKLVTSDNGDYYVVPFNVPAKVRPRVKRMPVEIERPKMSGLRKLERVKNVATNAVIEPVKVERTLVVVLVNAEDGSFKEASWVDDPVKYLPVSKIAAVKLALGEIDITSARELKRELRSKPTIELVYAGESPYYPDWKITVGGTVFYVSQDGTVSA